jgi:hypothetical protein
VGTAPKLLRNVFGATLAGPIKKNRFFFFANYEGRRDANTIVTRRQTMRNVTRLVSR